MFTVLGLRLQWASGAAAAMWAVGAFHAKAESLQEAIVLAYRYNPTLQAQRAALRALDETYVQARAGYGPTLNATGQVGPDQASVQQSAFTGGVTTVNSHGNTYTGSLTLTQPLYTGGRVRAEVDAAEAGILAGRENLRQSESQILLSVVTAYASVREAQELLGICRESLQILRKELSQTQERFRLRQDTRTDVAQAEARTAAAEAQLASTGARLDIARSQFLQAVGENPESLDEPPPFAALPATIDQAFDIGERSSPVVLAAQYTEQASHARIAEAKAASGPTVSLQLGLTSGPVEPYDPHFYQTNAQAMAVVNQPLFTSGLNSSRVRQSLEQNNRDLFNVDAARRTSIQGISQAWSQLIAARSARSAQDHQVTADQDAYVGVVKEQKYGLRTVLDVLNAEEELEASKSAVASSRYDEYVAQVNVVAAMGLLEIRFLAPDISAYDPAAEARKVVQKTGVPWIGLVQSLDSVTTATRQPPQPAVLDGRPTATARDATP